MAGRVLLFYLVQAPLGLLLTAACSAAGVLAALLDRSGRAMHRVSRFWSRALLRLLRVEVDVRGAAHVPAGPAVYAANHASVLDILVLFGYLPVDFRIVFKRSIASVPLFGWSLRLGGHVPIDRSHPFRARRSLEAAARRLGAGTSVVMFPEGTRSPDGSVRRFKRGSFSLALEAAVPVVPVSLAGVKAVAPRGLTRLRPGRILVAIAPPVPVAGRCAEEAPTLAEEVRGVVAAGCAALEREAAAPAGQARSLTAGNRSDVVALLLLALAAPAAADPAPAVLRRALRPIVERPELAAGFWGIEVRSLRSGAVLYELNAMHAFRPASTLKLVTTAAALDAYGPDARLRTTVETAGRLDALGRVLGDVYLVGRGDTCLSARFDPGRPAAAFEEMADALVAAGVRRIEGRLVGHDGAFAGERRGSGWTWEDLVWGYGAEVSALSWNDNLVELTLAPGERAGDPALADQSPQTPLLEVESTVVTGPAGSVEDVRLVKEPGSRRVLLSGTLPLGGSWDGRVAVPDPARFAAEAFASVLRAKGVRITGGVATSREALPADARVLAQHESRPMGELVRVVNKESQNLHAETLLRLVGLKQKGEGSVARGHEAVRELLGRLGVPGEGWGLSDGSGLARTDLVTPHGLAGLLVAMDRHPQAAAFRESLPVAGRDGTLARRMVGTAAEGRVTAKTGTLALANALAGYVTTARGDRLAFAIVVNNHEGRSREAVSALDAIAVALAAAR